VAERVRTFAVQAFTALDCAGLARVDFFVTPSFEIYLNEINTMPGFTRQSLFPMMWKASGLEYPKLVSRLINTALARGTGLH
jgi:D-alanine-D-alanine ligase